MFDLMVVRRSDSDKFDFNHLIPMPQELRNVTPCFEPDGKGGVKKVDKESGNPPEGDEKAGWDEWFAGHVPVEKGKLDEWRSRYGATNWYDWSWNNWGTNNNAFSFSTDYKDGSAAKFNFDTKWEFPDPIAKALSKKFPSLVFVWTVDNEGKWQGPDYHATFMNTRAASWSGQTVTGRAIN
jgi:hypothetical protein